MNYWAKSRTMKRAQGFSLIEFLVAMAIGLVVVAAVGFVYVGSRQTFRAQDAMARMQESARYAYELLAQDVRQAGLLGCPATTTRNVLNNSSWYGGVQDMPLVGYDAGVGTTGIASALAGRDALTVLRADNTGEYIISDHDDAAENFGLTGAHDLNVGEVVVACDPSQGHAAIFQITNIPPSGRVGFNTGAASAPGNCAKHLGPTDVCGGGPGTGFLFGNGSRLIRLSGVTYYIRNNTAGEPSLYRQRLSAVGGNAATAAEELVEGVENMQITYGVDTDATADGQVNAYQTATEIETGSGAPAGPGATAVDRWRRVLSVRISLLMVSRSTEAGVVTAAQTYTYNGAVVNAGDRLMRQVFTFVVAVRNRL